MIGWVAVFILGGCVGMLVQWLFADSDVDRMYGKWMNACSERDRALNEKAQALVMVNQMEVRENQAKRDARDLLVARQNLQLELCELKAAHARIHAEYQAARAEIVRLEGQVRG
jgi:predicted nucleotidyltransferase